jgi:dsDNA-specific endonuclease/ATPase MutS2
MDLTDPFDPFPEPVAVPITDVFDLHTLQPRDVTRAVEEYLNEVSNAGFRTVRIIHGKGIGVQKAIVRRILERTPMVISWTDAPPEAGGLGATIVMLKSLRE